MRAAQLNVNPLGTGGCPRSEIPRVTEFRFTSYFEHDVLRKRPYLRREWCIWVIQHAVREEPQEDNRVRFWAPVADLEGRFSPGGHPRRPRYYS